MSDGAVANRIRVNLRELRSLDTDARAQYSVYKRFRNVA